MKTGIGLNMFPKLSAQYLAHGSFGDAAGRSQISLENASRSIYLSNCNNSNLGQLTAAICLALLLTILAHHVSVVILNGAEEKMIWSNATWIIATMANSQTVQDWSKSPFIRQPVSKNRFDIFSAISQLKLTIAFRNFIACPIPACLGFIDLCPKTNLSGDSAALVNTSWHAGGLQKWR